ncbi:hypothetical protein [Corallococcus sp. CA047B]|uniref:hypothetical protein n=1 Tax=Corallococcus sp. CA047B TaxID=2316729 RepID=UPI0011C3BA22|nr:hypothetical protein [Corallococcus sp. CA047B]
MRSVWMWVVGLAVLPLMGCGGTGAAGESCSEEGCDVGLECRQDFPGGFCAQECTQEGAQAGCPADMLCARQSESLLCSPVCDSQSDCRDNYSCNGVSGTDQKACRILL